jgi:hypothetical protein
LLVCFPVQEEGDENAEDLETTSYDTEFDKSEDYMLVVNVPNNRVASDQDRCVILGKLVFHSFCKSVKKL